MFQFQYPYLIILLALPFVVSFLAKKPLFDRNSITPSVLNPNIIFLARAKGKKENLAKSKSSPFNIYAYLIWLLLTASLMHPQLIDKISKNTTMGYDILIAIDLSSSMRALDFIEDNKNINRLTAIKNVANKFISEREGDRIGLIAFGDNAYIQAPISSDRESIIKMLNMLEISMAGHATAIGEAIVLAAKILNKKTSKSPIMILLSDGSNTSGIISPNQAITLAKESGLKIYTIGVGSNNTVPYPTETGQIIQVLMEIDEKLLQEIASATGGLYYNAQKIEDLQKIYDSINKLEKSEIEHDNIITYTQLYQYPLSLAIILIFLYICYRSLFKRKDFKIFTIA